MLLPVPKIEEKLDCFAVRNNTVDVRAVSTSLRGPLAKVIPEVRHHGKHGVSQVLELLVGEPSAKVLEQGLGVRSLAHLRAEPGQVRYLHFADRRVQPS